MSLFDKQLVENSVSEKELCMIAPMYFLSKYMMIDHRSIDPETYKDLETYKDPETYKDLETYKEAMCTLENACVRMNMTEDEYKQIITKFIKYIW